MPWTAKQGNMLWPSKMNFNKNKMCSNDKGTKIKKREVRGGLHTIRTIERHVQIRCNLKMAQGQRQM